MRPNSIYSLHPGFAMEEAAERNILDRTGRTVTQWAELLLRDGPANDKARLEWLRTEHGITTNYAKWIVDRANGRGGAEAYDPDSLVESQYSGMKAALRPIYDKLLALGLALGPDVRACPGTTIVPLYRKNVFAQIKASTNNRVDLGLCLRGMPPSGRLVATGGEAKGDRITHKVAIHHMEEIDDELEDLLRRAYRAS